MPVNGQSEENMHPIRQSDISRGYSPMAGIAACIFQFAILVVLAAPIIYARPRWDILLTGSLWFAFSIYWSIAS